SRGDNRKAYRLAKKSNDMKRTPRAAEVMTKAACRDGDVGKAKAALKQIRLLDRAAIRKNCRQHGTRIGL
ncbi:MAG: hypothetical protein AAF721_40195, partial [Myxococcota bacterium]